MGKHSPGPWRVEGDKIRSADGVDVAEIEESRDARLIAAAPRMLELLREVVTEDYMAELIAYKTRSGLRCREEQEAFARMQALLTEIDGGS